MVFLFFKPLMFFFSKLEEMNLKNHKAWVRKGHTQKYIFSLVSSTENANISLKECMK